MTGADEDVCTDESSPAGVIVPGVEVIEPGFSVVDIPAVAQGIQGAQGVCLGAGDAQDIAPGVVAVAYHLVAACVHNAHHVTLCVAHIVVCHGRAGGVQQQGPRAVAIRILVSGETDSHVASLLGMTCGKALCNRG